MNIKQIGKTAIFVLLVLTGVICLNRTLAQKWLKSCYESVTFPEFEKLDDNSVEVCVLGSSQIVFGVSSMQLYGEHGISAYGLGSALQPLPVSYALLQQCRRTQDIKLVVLDISSLYEEPSASQWRKALDNMKLSPEKLEAVQTYMEVVEDPDSLSSFLLPLIKYHTRWNELTEQDFGIDSDKLTVYRGYYLNRFVRSQELSEMAYDQDEYDDSIQMIEYQKEALDQIVAYCEEQGIELLLIKTPKVDWSLTNHVQVQEYAEEKGIPFLEFTSLAMLEELGIDTTTDFCDGEHMNLRGASKLTAWLGNYISEHYELTDFRGTEGYEDSKYAEYTQDVLLYTTTDIMEYLANLNSDRYDITIQYLDDAPELYTPEIAEALQKLGLSVNVSDIAGQRYAAWLSQGVCKYENVSGEKDFNHYDTFADGTSFRIFSNFNEDAASKMTFDQEAVLFSERGIHIFVYDSEKQLRVDTTTIYYDENTDALQMIKEVWK